jgi:hypothetical protein
LQIRGQRLQAMPARAVERRYFTFLGPWQPTTNSSATSISLRKLPLWVRANRLRQDLRRAAFAPANAMIGGSRPEQSPRSDDQVTMSLRHKRHFRSLNPRLRGSPRHGQPPAATRLDVGCARYQVDAYLPQPGCGGLVVGGLA